MTSTTYLSEYVYNIVVECGKLTDSDGSDYITPRLTYKWVEIKEAFGELVDDLSVADQPECWFICQAKVVWKVIHSAAVAVTVATPAQKQDLNNLCLWACNHLQDGQYLDCSEPDILLAILHLTACLERALGNVYLTKTSPVPFLLRDLLKSAELHNVFGKIPMVFTQVLLGSPKGINLRNVAWHGFISPGELHPHLVAGLVVLISSLGELLANNQVVLQRPLFSSFEAFKEHLNGVFPNIVDDSEVVLNTIKSSPCISPNNQIYWERAFHLFCQERYGDSLILLIPQLEHCLRIIYCELNHCPLRLRTAEAVTLYTTLDEILAPSHSLKAYVGEGLLMMLLDLTTSLTGPRLRDRLSHGECDLAAIPRWLVNHTFCVALSTAHLHHADTSCASLSLCVPLRAASRCYRSCFHPASKLQQFLKACLVQWSVWQSYTISLELTIIPIASPHISALNSKLFPSASGVEEKLQAVFEKLNSIDPPTLYRPKPETDLAAGLASVVASLMNSGVNIQAAAETFHTKWCQHQLRSRTRATALRLWTSLPDLWAVFLCALQLATLCLHSLPSMALHCDASNKLLKSLTKAVDNTTSLCNSEKNRWSEAHAVWSSWAAFTSDWLIQHSHILDVS